MDAVNKALRDILPAGFAVETYTEHAIGTGSDSRACAYIGLSNADGRTVWGVGIHTDIINASLYALISAINHTK